MGLREFLLNLIDSFLDLLEVVVSGFGDKPQLNRVHQKAQTQTNQAQDKNILMGYLSLVHARVTVLPRLVCRVKRVDLFMTGESHYIDFVVAVGVDKHLQILDKLDCFGCGVVQDGLDRGDQMEVIHALQVFEAVEPVSQDPQYLPVPEKAVLLFPSHLDFLLQSAWEVLKQKQSLPEVGTEGLFCLMPVLLKTDETAMRHLAALLYQFFEQAVFYNELLECPQTLIRFVFDNGEVAICFRVEPANELMIVFDVFLPGIGFSQTHYYFEEFTTNNTLPIPNRRLRKKNYQQSSKCVIKIKYHPLSNLSQLWGMDKHLVRLDIFIFIGVGTDVYFYQRMRNFIQFNIDNIKGKQRAASLIDRDNSNNSPTKPKFHPRSNPNPNVYNRQTMPQKVKRLEGELSSVQHNQHLMDEIHEIRHDIKMIKSLLISTTKRKHSDADDQDEQEQETIYTHSKRMRSHGSEADDFKMGMKADDFKLGVNSQGSSPPKRVYKLQDIVLQKQQREGVGISLKLVFSAVKDYKIEGPEFGTIFYGYAKRNSQAVAIKYFEGKLNPVLDVYDRLWKNIAKAEWPCVNRIYDYKSEENNFLVMEKNKSNILNLPYTSILADIVKILQFIHDCGYLYRNIEPEHFMLNDEGQLVVIDMKRARRFVDIKGHPMEVADSIYTGSPFASNGQVRCQPECRKDDLESVGYLALLFLQMEIPWAGMSREQVIKVRSGLTLQELYRGQPQWVEFMAYVMKLPRHERPDYKYLIQVISK